MVAKIIENYVQLHKKTENNIIKAVQSQDVPKSPSSQESIQIEEFNEEELNQITIHAKDIILKPFNIATDLDEKISHLTALNNNVLEPYLSTPRFIRKLT
jgi:hypothetical protein